MAPLRSGSNMSKSSCVSRLADVGRVCNSSVRRSVVFALCQFILRGVLPVFFSGSGLRLMKAVVSAWWSERWLVMLSTSTKQALMISSSCLFTHTRSMVVPLVVEELTPKVGSPAGEHILRSQLPIRSNMLPAALSLVLQWGGFQIVEWRLASVTTSMGRSWILGGKLFISLSQASKPRKVLGSLYMFASSSVKSLMVIVHADISREGEEMGLREA